MQLARIRMLCSLEWFFSPSLSESFFTWKMCPSACFSCIFHVSVFCPSSENLRESNIVSISFHFWNRRVINDGFYTHQSQNVMKKYERGKNVDHCIEELCTWCHPSSYNKFIYVYMYMYTNTLYRCCFGPPSLFHNLALNVPSRCEKQSVPCVENSPWNSFEICLMMWIMKLWATSENETMYLLRPALWINAIQMKMSS